MSEIIAGFGYRKYVFQSDRDFIKAGEIYSRHENDEGGFEEEMEEAGIDFCYHIEGI